MNTLATFALYALAACAVIGLLFARLWRWQDQRAIEEKWRARELQLEHPRPTRPARADTLESLGQLVGDQPSGPSRARSARLLFIVARGQRELVEFLHKDFAAEEAEDVIAIITDRRQGPRGDVRGADGRRDPQRDRIVSTDLREIGYTIVRQPMPVARQAPSTRHALDPVLTGSDRA